MASLRNIMNVDEEHLDSQSIRKVQKPTSDLSQDHHRVIAPPPPLTSIAAAAATTTTTAAAAAASSSSSTSSSRTYPNQAILSTSSPPYSQPQDDTRPSHLHTSIAQPYSSPFAVTQDATHPVLLSSDRRSSAGQMDHRYGPTASQAHVVSFNNNSNNNSNNNTMRPFIPPITDTEPPVKLTPITRRVSRARKGVPVHTCDQCTPPKTFTRAEHLRRHKLSHNPPELACTRPGCGRVFHRKDLLERHQQRHDQDDGPLSRGEGHTLAHSPSGRSPPHYSNVPMMHELPQPSNKVSQLNPLVGTPPWQQPVADATPPQTSGSPNEEGSNYITTSMDSTPDYLPLGTNRPRTVHGPTGLGGILMQHSDSEGSYSPLSEPSRMQQSPVHVSSGWSDNMLYSTVPREAPGVALEAGGYPFTFGYTESPPPAYAGIYGEVMGGLPLPGFEDSSLYPQHASNTTVRSLSPQLGVSQSSETQTLVTPPPALSLSRMMNPKACGRQPDLPFTRMVTSHDEGPVQLGDEIRSAMPTYIQTYRCKALTLHPLVHRSILEEGAEMDLEHRDILECAMAAIGTQFLQQKKHRANGAKLHAYSWRKSKMYSQDKDMPLPIAQAVLLGEYFARFRGRCKEAYRPSPEFKTLYQTIFKQQISSDVVAQGRGPREQWKLWIEMETRRRLLSACFLLDVHSMVCFEQSSCGIPGLDYSSPRTLPIPLFRGTVALWEADDLRTWQSLDHRKTPQMTMANTMSSVVTPEVVAAGPHFDACLLLAAHFLELPTRTSQTTVKLIDDAASVRTDSFAITRLFDPGPAYSAYLALYHTPLHMILSVSGDSWVFNKKVLRAGSFLEHQQQLRKWRDSASAAVATAFAARNLERTFRFLPKDGSVDIIGEGGINAWVEISAFWPTYVCTLICWAFGYVEQRPSGAATLTRSDAMHWIRTAASMQPEELMKWPRRHDACAVVDLVREVMEKDCLGGRNILFADAAGVLRRLCEEDSCKWF